MALLENAQEAGFYVARVSVQSPGMPVAVNVDTRESDVACLGESNLRTSLEGTGITVAATETDLLAAIETTRTGRSSWKRNLPTVTVILLAAVGITVIMRLPSARQPRDNSH